jgi:phospholipase C
VAADPNGPGRPGPQATTPIRHIVVIFQENVSFDHYFATYPNATNPPGEPAFHAAPDTPAVNGLTPTLLTQNPNADQPFRLGPAQAVTCDMNHGYTAEQKAVDGGLVDRYVQSTACKSAPQGVMGYYDGNTVTALWNYAQHFSLADESFGTTFGPSSPGAINLISGQTGGAVATGTGAPVLNGTLYSDVDPTYDACSQTEDNATATVAMTGTNVGDLMNAKGITWGWFEGGFTPTATTAAGLPVCGAQHTGLAGPMADYIPHHEPFQYYRSAANPDHLPPTSVAMIGRTDQANHQYGLRSFWAAVDAGNMPQVSFLKASGYQDGHPGYSDPLDEQTFLVNTINRLEKTPDWRSTAVFITWDDSDGWYDHVAPVIVNQSNTSLDALTNGTCGTGAPAAGIETRCGYGPRIPVLAISPYARTNSVFSQPVASQASILQFIEDNWNLGRIGGGSFDALTGSLGGMFDFHQRPAPPLFLNPSTGEVAGPGH